MSRKPAREGPQGRPRPGRASVALTEEKEPTKADAEALLQQSRLRQAQAQLEASHASYSQLCSENQHLQELRRHEEREGYELSELFRRQLLAKNEQLVTLQQEAATAAARLQEAEVVATKHKAQLQEKFEAERQQLGEAAAALQAQLDGVARFQQEKEAMEAEMQRLRSDNVHIAEDLGEKVRTLQLRLYELGYGPDGMSEGLMAAASEEEDGGLYLETNLHRLLVHSCKVQDEMKQYGQEAEELQKKMKALERERAALLRDVQLKEELEAQYAKRGTLQAREIRDAHSKVGTLERGLAQMAADFEMEKAQLEQQLRAQLANSVNEQNGLRHLLRLRTRELRQLRHLAQEVLLQRSDVEAFLLSGIQQVRAEIAAAAAVAMAARDSPPPQQPLKPAPAASPSVLMLPGEASGSVASTTRVLAAGSSMLALSRQGRAASKATVPSTATTSPAVTNLASERSPSRAAGTLGGVGGTSPIAAQEAASPDAGGLAWQVDIKDLSWEDRERILCLLFAKINKAAQRSAVPAMQRSQALSEAQAEVPLPSLRGLATEAGPASLA